MGLLIVIALLVLSAGMIFITIKRLRLRQSARGWWMAFCCLTIIGLAIGYWMAFHFEYKVSARMRVASFPIPVAFFHLEENQWVDFPTPKYFGYPAMLTNIIFITSVAISPIWMAARLLRGSEPMHTT